MSFLSVYRLFVRFVTVLSLIILLLSCTSSEPVKSVRLAGTASLLNSLVWIAHEKGYFKEQGLNVLFKVYPTGKRSLLGMLDGHADVVTTADIPFMAKLYDYPDLRIVATVGSADDELKVVTRTDRGIFSPSDLKGKIIATQEASAVHFFLHLYLLQHYISEDDVSIPFMKAEELPVALAQGKIDAMTMREPFITKASELLKGHIQIFSEPALYRKTYNLVAHAEFIKNNPDVIEKLLKALLKAENFVEHNPDQAKEIMAHLLKTDKNSVDRLWNNFVLKVVLEQDFLLQMQTQEQWMQKIANKTNQTQALPLFKALYLDALIKISPERVGLKPITSENP